MAGAATASLSVQSAAAVPATQAVVFVLPRADWIASNASLMHRLAQDPDIAVTVVAPEGYRLTGNARGIRLIEYPFYDPPPKGSAASRCAQTFVVSRRRRAAVDSIFQQVRPDCLIVISDTSRESVPFVRIAHRRRVRVVFMQSVFLAASLRQHVRSENWALVKGRGLSGLLRLAGLRIINLAAGLPATVLKSSSVGGASDVVFAINEHQKRVLEETARPDAIYATGTPFVDSLHATIHGESRRGRPEFGRSIGCDDRQPLVSYFSKSLEQFCHLDAGSERAAQEFFVDTILEQLPTAMVVVKLHPIEDDRAFHTYLGHPRVRVLKDANVHELIHHSSLVVSLGTSTPALHAVFHGRPRLIITRVREVRLDYQQDLLRVSTAVASNEDYVEALRRVAAAGWPERLPPGFEVPQSELERFTAGFDGLATGRVHARLRELLGLAVSS